MPAAMINGTRGWVAEWLSGANSDNRFLPRINTEVPVDFIHGDIDRSVIVGQHYYGADLPPFSAGHEAWANHPGVISGWMSHNHEAGYNQWVIDDAPERFTTPLPRYKRVASVTKLHILFVAPQHQSEDNCDCLLHFQKMDLCPPCAGIFLPGFRYYRVRGSAEQIAIAGDLAEPETLLKPSCGRPDFTFQTGKKEARLSGLSCGLSPPPSIRVGLDAYIQWR